MIRLGDCFPPYELAAVKADQHFRLTPKTFEDKWRIYFFWPRDFTPVCASEIAEFSLLYSEFNDRDSTVIGVSTDSESDHLAWQRALNIEVPFPMLSDVHGKLCLALGVLDTRERVAQRATFIVDPSNVIRFVSVNDFLVGRNPTEVLRILDALQTRMLCPSNWHRGQAVLG